MDPLSIELANAITVANATEEGKGVVLEGDFVHVQEAPDNVDPETGEIGGVTYAQLFDKLNAAKDAEAAALVLDEARGLPADQYDEITAAYTRKYGGGK